MENNKKKKLDDEEDSHPKFLRFVEIMSPNGKEAQYAMLIGCFILALLILVGLLLPSISCSVFFVQLSSTCVYPFIIASGLGVELIFIFFTVIALCRLILCDEIKGNSLKIKSKKNNSIVENVDKIRSKTRKGYENGDQVDQINDMNSETKK